MPRLPLVPSRRTVGGFALLLFLMTLMGTALFFSFAAARWTPTDQLRLQAVVAAVLVVLGGVAVAFFLTDENDA